MPCDRAFAEGRVFDVSTFRSKADAELYADALKSAHRALKELYGEEFRVTVEPWAPRAGWWQVVVWEN